MKSQRLTAEVVRARIADGTLVLCSGKGDTEEGACCVMQAEAILLGRDGDEDDDPERLVVAGWARRLNDRLRDDERARLVPYVARIAESPVETVAMKRRRAFMLADSAVRSFAPTAIELRAARVKDEKTKAALVDGAARMRAGAEIVDRASAIVGRDVAREVHAAADAAADAYADAAADAAAYAAADAYVAAAAYAYAAADAAADAAAVRKRIIDDSFALLDRLLSVRE